MRVTINNAEVNIPSSLSEITLGQKIEYQRQHGDLLDEMLKSIFEIEDEFERELELVEFQSEKMFRTFAFFARVQPEALKESEFIDKVSSIYHATLATINEDEDSIELQQEFLWNGELWYLHSPELKNGDKMKFGELIDAKQIVQDMMGLGANKWECMLPLCAIYLRRKDEAYNESFLYEGSERQELMKGLPLDIAMQVGFFLTSSVNIYLNTSRSSGLHVLSQAGRTLKSTLSGSDGSISLLQ